jgi:hypothetical protein
MKRLEKIANRLVCGGPVFDGITVAAEWLEDYAATVSGKMEELKGSTGITKTELNGALSAVQAAQKQEGWDDNLEKISVKVRQMMAEVDDLNRLSASVVRRMVVKLAEVERDSVDLQHELIRMKKG